MRYVASLTVFVLLAGTANKVASMAAPSCRVCMSSSCTPNGSALLLDALQSLTSEDASSVDIKGDSCLGGCGGGVIVKTVSAGSTRPKKHAYDPVTTELLALEQAAELLEGMGALDNEAFQQLRAKAKDGDRALLNSEPPEVCAQCGNGLQLYRGNCAKCGKYPY